MRFFAIILITCNWLNITAQNNTEPYEKGEFRIKLAFPFVNHVTINPIDEPRIGEYGFFAGSLGIEYSVSDKSFVEFSYASAATFSSLNFRGPYEYLSTTHLSGTYYKIFSPFAVGCGLNYSNTQLERGYRSFGDSLVPTFSDDRQSRAIGLTFNGFYRLGKTLNIGLNYRPTFYNLKPKEVFSYDHLLSLEFNWRFRLNKK